MRRMGSLRALCKWKSTSRNVWDRTRLPSRGSAQSSTREPVALCKQESLPCRGSYCRICTSSMHSAGNQPVRPFTVPSQKPPSPILSTMERERETQIRTGRASVPRDSAEYKTTMLKCTTEGTSLEYKQGNRERSRPKALCKACVLSFQTPRLESETLGV